MHVPGKVKKVDKLICLKLGEEFIFMLKESEGEKKVEKKSKKK